MDNIVSVSSLKKSFKKTPVLKGISFNICKGSIFALLGANGAGKTTTVRILSTLSRPDSGSASICGYDVVRQADDVRACISLTGQYAAVDDIMTGRENLRLIGSLKGLSNINKRTNELLEAFQLEDAANRRVSTYSGGMRRRLDIAMSLMGSPQVIFLDEPTAGLDPQGRIATWHKVKGLADGGTTVFLTTQYLDEAEFLANHIAILHDGKITAKGTPDELKTVLPRGGVQLNFQNDVYMKKACGLLKEYHISLNGTTLDIITDGSATQFADVLTRLNNESIPIIQFTQKLPSLEDVFLTLTKKVADKVE